LPSGGDRTVQLTVDAIRGLSYSSQGVTMTQVYWDADGRAGPTLPVQLAASPTNSTQINATIPAALVPITAPGQGIIYLGNPALVDGRNGAVDQFETPNTLVRPAPANTGLAKYMKLCDPTEDKVVLYSRAPTISAITDIRATGAGTFTIPDIVIADPDIPTFGETIQSQAVSFNNGVASITALTATTAGPSGTGTFTLTGTINTSTSGFSVIQVTASDGVTTTVRAFRVVIPSAEDGTGCGGGMGLALLTIPLAAWFVRRRKRG
jgi:hypothetical protein